MCVVFRLCLRVYSVLLTEGPSITQVIEVTGNPPPLNTTALISTALISAVLSSGYIMH